MRGRLQSAMVVVIDQRTKILEKCRRAKNRESRRRQRQSEAAENRAAGLTASAFFVTVRAGTAYRKI